MSEKSIYEQTLTSQFANEYFKNQTYSGTIESSILHLIAEFFSDDLLKINGTQIVCEDERRERIIQARAMFFWYLNKCLGYSHYAIYRKYGFHNNNVGKLVRKHEKNIETETFIFHIHKKVYEMGQIWQETAITENNVQIVVVPKEKKQIKKLSNAN